MVKRGLWLIAFVVLLAACGVLRQAQDAPTEIEVTRIVEVEITPMPEVPHLWFVMFNTQHPVVKLMRLGFLDACAELGSEVVCDEILVAEPDLDAYVSAMEQAAALGGDGAVIWADTEALYVGADALTAEMPTVSFHVPHERGESHTYAWVSADVEAYSREAAVRMCEQLGDGGTVARSMSNSGGLEERMVMPAFEAAYAEACPNTEILPVLIEGLDLNAAISVAASELLAHPDLTGAFSSTGNGATTWATALRDGGYEPGAVVVVGMDYVESNLALIESGEVWGLVGQPLVEEVYAATMIAHTMAMGGPYQEQNWLPAPFVTAENVERFWDYTVRSQE